MQINLKKKACNDIQKLEWTENEAISINIGYIITCLRTSYAHMHLRVSAHKYSVMVVKM